jgi:hypothetical protein
LPKTPPSGPQTIIIYTPNPFPSTEGVYSPKYEDQDRGDREE